MRVYYKFTYMYHFPNYLYLYSLNKDTIVSVVKLLELYMISDEQNQEYHP